MITIKKEPFIVGFLGNLVFVLLNMFLLKEAPLIILVVLTTIEIILFSVTYTLTYYQSVSQQK